MAREVNDLKAKYSRCLRVQDKLFLQYFKEKEQDNERIHKLEIDKNNLKAENGAVEANLTTIQDSFHALSKKTEV